MEIVETSEVISEAEVVTGVVEATFEEVIVEVVAEVVVISAAAVIFVVGVISAAAVVEGVEVLRTLARLSSGLPLTPRCFLNKSNPLAIDRAKLSHHLMPPSPRPKTTSPKLLL